MRIGNIVLENPLVLAPMARITQVPMRRLAREAGCALVVSEMVSANGLVHRTRKTEALLTAHPLERPLAVQIFGSDAVVMEEAADIVARSGADMIDINLGCSVGRIVKQKAGVALMREPERLEAILRAVRGAVHIPLTVKMRTGWEPSGIQAVRTARVAEFCGADAVVIHPRTAVQGFRGRADWSLIAKVKKAVSIPVIGNGDVRAPEDVMRMQHETNCDGVMIGRAAVGNPWIFTQSLDRLNNRPVRRPDPEMRLDAVVRYVNYAVDHFGEARAIPMMRSRVCWFTKGLPYGSRLRQGLTHARGREEIMTMVSSYFNQLPRSEQTDRNHPLT